MRTGDVVRDAQGRSYQVGPLLGRGLWGKSYLCRQTDNDVEVVLKHPLGREDFRADVPLPDTLLRACIDAATEQAELLGAERYAFLPALHAKPSAEVPAVLTPRFGTTLERRIHQGCTLAEVLGVVIAVMKLLAELAPGFGPHGNLRPSNVLLSERGDVALSDLATPAARKALAGLRTLGADPNPYLPPEAGTSADGALPPSVDSYAACMILYRAIMTPRDGDSDGRLVIKLPRKGLDKAGLVQLRDRAVERLKQEDSNPRFHARFAERIASVLNRALAEQTSPSPPYRFLNNEELLPRLEEIRGLIRPNITTVGKVMLSRPPASEVFETDEDVAFTVTVGASVGVDSHEEIACGIAVFNAETNERNREVRCAYTVEKHPSGRYRFTFKLENAEPGRYRCRLAFAIRDSGHAPATAETELEVRAAAGYVPPKREHGATALPFTRSRDGEETAATQPRAGEEYAQDLDLDDDGTPAPFPIPLRPAAPEPTRVTVPAAQAPRVELEPPRVEPPRVEMPRITPTLSPPSLSAANDDPYVIPSVQVHVTDSVERETTEPSFSVSTKVPPVRSPKEILGTGSWSELPLPGGGEVDELPAPELDDEPGPAQPNIVRRFFDIIRGDTYLLYMTIAALFIIALSVILFLLDR